MSCNQPVVVAKDGIVRFKENVLVSHLYDYASMRGCSMNELCLVDATDEDRMQLAQLIGYSVSGYSTLSYASDSSVEAAFKESDALLNPQTEEPAETDGGIGWVQVMDDLLTCAHLGVAHAADTYKTARSKAMSLLALEADIACNPAVNGGKVLVNQKQLKALLTYFAQGDMPEGVRECLTQTLEELG